MKHLKQHDFQTTETCSLVVLSLETLKSCSGRPHSSEGGGRRRPVSASFWCFLGNFPRRFLGFLQPHGSNLCL